VSFIVIVDGTGLIIDRPGIGPSKLLKTALPVPPSGVTHAYRNLTDRYRSLRRNLADRVYPTHDGVVITLSRSQKAARFILRLAARWRTASEAATVSHFVELIFRAG
jgi:hypothetical protein